jgi:homeobox KN domain-containing protein
LKRENNTSGTEAYNLDSDLPQFDPISGSAPSEFDGCMRDIKDLLDNPYHVQTGEPAEGLRPAALGNVAFQDGTHKLVEVSEEAPSAGPHKHDSIPTWISGGHTKEQGHIDMSRTISWTEERKAKAYCSSSLGIEHNKQETRRVRFPDLSVGVLREWWQSHQNNPYPTASELEELSCSSKLTKKQVKTWFANERSRSSKRRDLSGMTPLERWEASASEDEGADLGDIIREASRLSSSPSPPPTLRRLPRKNVSNTPIPVRKGLSQSGRTHTFEFLSQADHFLLKLA